MSLLVFFVSRDLPDVDTISTYVPAETTKIFAADGTSIADLHQEENRIYIPLSKISPNIQKTVIAVEDTDFYSHHGVNIKGIFRAFFKDILTMSFDQGGSTLTQQLARNIFLNKHKSITRKLREILLAIQIERKYTKNEIFEMYLNQVYWGHNAYGIESASQLYFGKHAEELSLPEAALIVGLLKGPELFSPFKSYENAKARQKVVLGRMQRVGLITKEEARLAYEEKLDLAPRQRHRFKAPYFTSYIVEKLIQLYGEDATFTSGMKVYTTLDYKLQLIAADTVKKYREDSLRRGNTAHYSQAAILAIEPQTGYVKVMQGGVDFDESQFNRCIQAKRQPGSTFKPFVYLAALEKGFSPGSIINDSPISFNLGNGNTYSPQNFTKSFLGPITLRKALQESVNVVAIKLTNIVGPHNVVRIAHELGIESELRAVLSLPLGANEVNMLELTSAYGVLANNGVRVEPTCILRIEDRNGVPIYQHAIREKQVVEPKYISALVDMMKDVVTYGSGRAAKLPRPMAGKTGTTSDYRDAWFIGFVPQLVCATWVGNDNNTKMNKVTGGSIPANMWRDFMKYALENIPPEDFKRNTDLIERKINSKTGLVATDVSPSQDITVEKYWKGSEPTREDSTVHSQLIPASPTPNKNNQDEILDFFQMH